jgi:hypothetical protein
MPMCGVDFEPNVGDTVGDVRMTDSLVRGNQKCGVFLQSGLGAAGQRFTFLDNVFDGNGTIGLVMNQDQKLIAAYNKVTGGTIGYSIGAGARDATVLDNETSGNTGNAMNLAGVWNPTLLRNTLGGRPLAIIAIPNPAMNGVAGDVVMRGNQ